MHPRTLPGGRVETGEYVIAPPLVRSAGMQTECSPC